MSAEKVVNRQYSAYAGPAATRTPSLVPRLAAQLCVVAFAALLLMGIRTDTGASPSTTLDRIAWLALMQFVAQLAVLAFAFGSVLAPPVVFSALLSLFTSSWLLLRTVGLQYSGADVVGREIPASIASAATFYVVAFACYCTGVVLVGVSRERKLRSHEFDVSKSLALTWVGAACVVVGVVPFIVLTVNNFRVVLSGGYSAYYQPGSRLDSPILTLSYFFIVGLVFLGVAGESRVVKRICIVIGMIGVLRLAIGDRGEGMTYLLTALLLWRSARDENAPRKGLRTAVGTSVFAILVTPAIGTLRQSFGGGRFDVGSALLEQNPIVVTLQTMGATLFPLIKVQELVPAGQEFLGGATYLSGFLRILPSWLLPSSAEPLAQDALYSSPATWLMERLGMSYGPGFTPFAEAHLNFGEWGGCAAMLVFGIVVAFALRLPVRPSPFRLAFVLATFVLCGFSVRGSSNFLIPVLIRFVLAPLAFAAVLAPTIRARRPVDA